MTTTVEMTDMTEALPHELAQPGITREGIDALSRYAADPDWLRERRVAAWETFDRLPMPSRRDEKWRFTNLRRVQLDDVRAYSPAQDQAGVQARIAAADLTGEAELAGRVTHVNGATVNVEAGTLPEGVVFLPLDEAVREHPELVQRWLGMAVTPGDDVDDKFVALQEATWSSGVFLYVPRNVRVEAPFLADVVHAGAGSSVNWRALIVLDEGAEATFVEQYVSTGSDDAGFSNVVVELVAGPGSNLHYVTSQDYALPVTHFATHRLVADRDSQVEWTAVGLGASLGKSRMEVRLVGAGCSVKLNGAYFLDGRQELDYDTQQFHEAPNATSDLSFRGALTDRAHSVWRGMIDVSEGAQGTDAYQENRNLLLTPRAHADSIPGLQILANEVRCTHGATISKVDQDQLFYLQARGVPKEEAVKTIVRGFFVPVLDRISVEPVRDAVRQALHDRMDAAAR